MFRRSKQIRSGRTLPVGRRRQIYCTAMIVAGLLSLVVTPADGQTLTPSSALMNAFHAPRIGDAAVAENQANAFTILTNGVVDRGQVDRIDTWQADDAGVATDFVGLRYASPQRFDTINIELGFQFVDGGDWQSMPRIFILKNPTLVGDTVSPEMSPNWVEVLGATETAGHVFSPLVTPGPPTTNGTIQLNLSAIPAANRTGWGWAVGGVDGNQNASNIFNFISLTEVSATGASASAPLIPQPLTPTPVNVISNAYNSVSRNNDALIGWRGQAFASVVNGVIQHDNGGDGFDTFQGDTSGTLTDFAGLQYSSRYRFDTLTAELAVQFGDGGDWETVPRIFILKNPVDTNTSRPESDPTNWREITGASETTGHVFSPLVTPGPGGTVRFDLSSIPAADRTGWGWAIGGVDGNANASGVINFVSVTELSATGALIPRPYDLELEVNTTTGRVQITNETTSPIPLDFYEITSNADSLNIAGWNSLENPAGNPAGFPAGNGTGNGWEEMGNLDNGILAESYLQDISTLAAGGLIDLGNAFTVGAGQDLVFRYRTSGGAFVDAAVQYVTSAAVAGDYNNNGIVDAADYVIWRKRLGPGSLPNEGGISPGVVDTADYNFWRSRFGATSGSGSALGESAVPEPGTLLLCLGSAIVGILSSARSQPKKR
jgi:hypothetical protein